MTQDRFHGYQEGVDISKVPAGYLSFPSKNVFIHKDTVSTRGGLVNDGIAKTVDEPIHSEFVWKDAPGGQRFMRVHGTTLQVKVGVNWITIFTGLDSGVTRVFFDTWIDSNTTVIKKRLFFCDGSTNLYSWNGFIGTVDSFATPAITMVADKANLGLMGADAGDITTQTVTIYSLDGDGIVDATEEEVYSVDPTSGLTMALDAQPSAFTVAPGDLVIAKPTTDANAVSSTFNIDVVFNYQNHLVCAQFDSVEVFFSDIAVYVLATGLDFTQPTVGSRTALTPIYLRLEGGFQAMVSRKGVLWVSDTDDWYKVTKTVEINAYGLWLDVEKFETGENKGALPMAVAKHKGDIIYMAKDFTLQRITTIDVLGKDDILLLSDDVEGLLLRMNTSGVRLYYTDRAIYIVFPASSTIVILDTAEQIWYFQPPSVIPINCISVFQGVKYGHHNGHNETYELFSGNNDLGSARAEAIIATGLLHNTTGNANEHFSYKEYSTFGIDCRISPSTKVSIERRAEEAGSKAITTMEIDGKVIKTFSDIDDVSWGTNPYGSRSWGGADLVASNLKRAFVFDREVQGGHFEMRTIMKISGSESQFHLLGIFMDSKKSPRDIGDDLFITRGL